MKVTWRLLRKHVFSFCGDISPGSYSRRILTGEALHEAAMLKKFTAGGLEGWAWNEIEALSLSWVVGLAQVLRQMESAKQWRQCLLDASIAIIPKAEGDSTPLGQRHLSVLPVVYRIWASVRLAHIQE